MSQKEWAEYFLGQGKVENAEVGWSPGEQSGRSSPVQAMRYFQNLESQPSSPKAYGNIVAASFKASGKSRKSRARGMKRKNRKSRKSRKSRRSNRR